jgi:hypothetical protein
MHKACAEAYGLWKAAKDGCKKLICAAVEEVYINELKDGTTFFHKVNAWDLFEHLKKTLQASMLSTSLPFAQTCSFSTKMQPACRTSS